MKVSQNFSKDIELLVDSTLKEKNKNIEFEYRPSAFLELKGTISKKDNFIEINLPKLPEEELETFAKHMGEKEYSYSAKNENQTYSYDAKRNEVAMFTKLENDIRNITELGLKKFKNLKSTNFRHINEDGNGNKTESLLKNGKIVKINYNNFNYSEDMSKEKLNKEIAKLKYNEAAILRNYFEENPETVVPKIIQSLRNRVKVKEKQLFEYEDDNEEILKIIEIPENYTGKDLAESISLKIGMTGTTVNLKREQYNLVPALMENSKFLNAKCYVNFTLNRPKDEKFYLDPKSIEIQLQGMRTLNIKKSYETASTYKEMFKLGNDTSIKIYDEFRAPIYSEEAERQIIEYSVDDRRADPEDFEMAKEVSLLNGKKIYIKDRLENAYSIKGDSFSIRSGEFAFISDGPENYIKKNNLDKIFKNISCRDGVLKGAKEEKQKNFSMGR